MTTRTVTTNNETGIGSITEIINEANAGDIIKFELEDGDTITLTQTITINKSLKIINEGLDAVVIIPPSYTPPSSTTAAFNVVRSSDLTNYEVTIEKIIFDCKLNNQIPIVASLNGNININGCDFILDSTETCCGIFINTGENDISNVSVNNCTFSRSEDLSFVGSFIGILVDSEEQTSIDVDSCTFDNLENNITGGSAIQTIASVIGSITNCTFNKNSSNTENFFTMRGGAINILCNDFEILNCTFNNNSCTSTQTNNRGGAIYLEIANAEAIVNMFNNTYNNNSCRGTGAAIYIVTTPNSELNIDGNNFVSNGSGYAIGLINYGTANITNCVINDGGSGLYYNAYQYSSLFFTSCAIVNNTSQSSFIYLISNNDTSTDPNAGRTVNIQNSTIANNTNTSLGSNPTIYLTFQTQGLITFTNNTIANNTATFNVVAGITTSRGYANQYIFNNNIIANNIGTEGESNISGTASYYDVDSSHNNIISFDDIIFPNGENGNQIGKTGAPLGDLYLGELSYQNNTWVIPLLRGSPAIDRGSNEFGYQGDYDQRGYHYVRRYNQIIDIGAFEFQPFSIPCFDGDSIVITKNINTGNVEKIKVKDVYAGIHEVYDSINKKFIAVRNNAVTEGATRLMVFEKDSIGPNQPNRELRITPGHALYINGQEIKAKYVEGGKRIKVKPQKVYSIVTDIWTPIRINGLDVFAWSKYKWMKNTNKNCITWTENRQR